MVRLMITLYSVLFTFSVAAHPYDAPLKFRKHMTDDGRVIWSNIPKACFSKGLLTCDNLHPIYGNSIPPERAASSSVKKPGLTQDKQKAPTANTATTTNACDKQSCSEMTSCDEAKFYLAQCGLSGLDRDGDGVPCESICKQQ